MECHGDNFRDFTCKQNPKRFAQILSDQPLCHKEPPKLEEPDALDELTKRIIEDKMGTKKPTKKLSLDKVSPKGDSDLIALYDISELVRLLYQTNMSGNPVIIGDLKQINKVLIDIANITRERLEDGDSD